MRDIIKMQYPASWWHDMWREGLPTGNGMTGASLYGGSKREILQFSRHDFWYNGDAGELPDVHDALERQRAKIDAGNFKEASWEIVNALKEKKYESRLEAQIPLARMIVTQDTEKGFQKFERGLDLKQGLAFQKWMDGEKPMKREVFVSRCEDVAVYHLTAGEEGSNFSLCFETYRNDGENETDAMKEIWDSEEKEFSVEQKASWIFLHAHRRIRNGKYAGFGGVARIELPKGGKVSVLKDTLIIKKTPEILITFCFYAEGEKEICQKEYREKLEKFSEHGRRTFGELLSESAKLHRELYQSAELSFDDKWESTNEELLLRSYGEDEQPVELMDKLWHYGRYLFLCGSAPEGNPFPLYGLWGGRYRPMWCHNMANENMQMIYWHSFVGNLVEYQQSMFHYLNDRISVFRNNAEKLFGINGIYLTAGTTPGVAEPTQVVPVIINWVGAAGWMAQHYYQYYLFTRDENYKKEIMLPFMEGVADFYEKYVRFQEKDGREIIQFYPSVSPENTPQNFMPPEGEQMAHPMPTTVNSTIDLAILKEFFANMLAIDDGQDGSYFERERVELWKRILKSIPEYRTNEKGAIKEWQDERFEDRYDHRHLSHIYPVFPGHECYALKNPQQEEAFEKAVKLRKIDAQTGWSMAHMAAIYARFRDGNAAMECLDKMAKSSILSNFFTLHNDWRGMNVSLVMDQAPVQLDAILGYVNALQEMLIYVAPGYLSLLPALCERTMRGEFRRFRYYDGFVSAKWDAKKGSLDGELRGLREHTLTFVQPDYIQELVWEKEDGITVSRQSDKEWLLQFSKEGSIRFYAKQIKE